MLNSGAGRVAKNVFPNVVTVKKNMDRFRLGHARKNVKYNEILKKKPKNKSKKVIDGRCFKK